MTEFELIQRIFADLSPEMSPAQRKSATLAEVVCGIGDDAAVIQPTSGTVLVSCMDTMVQGRHFDEAWAAVDELAFMIGYKAVAVNMSDLAAMGAVPHSILLGLSLPERLANSSWLERFAKGLFHACQQYGVVLIGGDTTRHDKLVITVTAQGWLAKDLRPIYRSGAKVGDLVYVSGTLGDAAYALQHPMTPAGRALSHRLQMPTPRVALGQALVKQGAVTAMIDVSDGLAQDLGHICRASGVAMQLDLEALPTSTELAQVELAQRLTHQLTGGDDYELAFTLPADVAPAQGHTSVTCIGKVVAPMRYQPAVQLRYEGNSVTPEHPYPFAQFPDLAGWSHF